MGWWFSFNGRIGRRTWWLGYILPLIGIAIVATVIDVQLGFVEVKPQDAAPADGFAVETQGIGPFGIVSMLLSLVGGLAGQVKRWHDRDKAGWWVLINFIPLVGPIWALVETGFLRGTSGPNRFGPDPLGGAGAGAWQPAPPQGQWQPQGQWHPPQQQPQWQPPPAQGWQPPQGQWQPPPQGPGGYPPPGWQPQPPPPGYPPPQGPGAPPPGQGQPPPGYGQPPQGGQWGGPGRGGSVPPVRRE